MRKTNRELRASNQTSEWLQHSQCSSFCVEILNGTLPPTGHSVYLTHTRRDCIRRRRHVRAACIDFYMNSKIQLLYHHVVSSFIDPWKGHMSVLWPPTFQTSSLGV